MANKSVTVNERVLCSGLRMARNVSTGLNGLFGIADRRRKGIKRDIEN